MLPNFIIGGAQKAGTTSLHWRLQGHPDVFIPRKPQEIHFFDDDRNFARGIAWYEALFSGWSGQKRVGQTSPRYLYDPASPSRIHSSLPDVRLIFLLRNPVERAYSHYWHSVKMGFETLGFEQALEREAERLSGGFEARRDFSYVDRGRYAEQLERYFALFAREQVLVLLDPPSSPEADRRCAAFLGIDPARFPARASSSKQSNASRLPRVQAVQRITRHLRDPFPRLVAAVDRLNLRTAAYPPMAPAVRRRLVERLAPEVRALETLLGVDLEAWRR